MAIQPPEGHLNVEGFDKNMTLYSETLNPRAATGVTPDKLRASRLETGSPTGETWFYAHSMGSKRNSVYDGGWFEWSQDPIASQIGYGESEELTA